MTSSQFENNITTSQTTIPIPIPIPQTAHIAHFYPYNYPGFPFPSNFRFHGVNNNFKFHDIGIALPSHMFKNTN